MTNDVAATYAHDSYAGSDGLAHPFTRGRIGYQLQDYVGNNGSSSNSNLDSGNMGWGYFYLMGEGAFSGADMGQTWMIHRMSVAQPAQGKSYPTSKSLGLVFNNLDWYRECGTITNEQMVLFPSSDVTTTVSSNALPTDVIINVASTTGYPTSGIIIINGEVISYTGITSTSFTGCSRGQYSTQIYSQFIGDIVYIGAWLVKINYGYLFAGYQVPS